MCIPSLIVHQSTTYIINGLFSILRVTMCKHGPYSMVSGGKVKVERVVVLRWDKHGWLQEISFESFKGLVALFAPLKVNVFLRR